MADEARTIAQRSSERPAALRTAEKHTGGPSKPRRRKKTSWRRVRAFFRLKRVRAVVRWGSFGVIALVFASVIGVYVFAHRPGPKHANVEVEISENMSFGDIATLLADSDLVESRTLTLAYLSLSTDKKDLVPGPHLLSGGRTPSELRDLLTRSMMRAKVKVTIPEGFNRFTIADRLDSLGVTGRSAFLRATESPQILSDLGVPGPAGGAPESAEGYLFPATYDLALDTPPEEVVGTLVGEANRRWSRLALTHEDALTDLEKRLGYGRREVMILASMIEKEAAKADERPIIASVFFNRLTDPTFTPRKLQSDPTSGYGCLSAPTLASCAGFDGKITPRMNQDKQNRYSTYVIEGLPPGPISNPGTSSIAAVLDPSNTKYLYFVAKGGGRHAFSETLDEHKRAVHGEPQQQ